MEYAAAATSAVAPTSTDREVINGVKISGVQHTANVAGGSAVHNGEEMITVAQPDPSFSLDLPGDQVAAATTLPMVGDKTMQASAGSTSTPMMTIHGSTSTVSMLTGSGTTASPTKVHDTNCESLVVPKVGMAFKSEEEAYEFYNNYADTNPKHTSLSADGKMVAVLGTIMTVWVMLIEGKTTPNVCISTCSPCVPPLFNLEATTLLPIAQHAAVNAYTGYCAVNARGKENLPASGFGQSNTGRRGGWISRFKVEQG
ncbi:hypothetical protein ACQ4PT_026110 [Festuca glaucescens]